MYWLGLRIGELLALTPADYDFNKNTVSVNKSLQRIKGKDVVTPPKTEKSNRVITMPQFLADEMQNCIGLLFIVIPNIQLQNHHLQHYTHSI